MRCHGRRVSCSWCHARLAPGEVRREQYVAYRRGVQPRMIRRLCDECVAEAHRGAARLAPEGTAEFSRQFHTLLAERFTAA